MKKALLVASLTLMFLVFAAGTAHAKGPWKVEVMQFGAPTRQVQAGTPFEVRISGFHARVLPVKICVDGRGCSLASVDTRGDYVETRVLTQTGNFNIEISQAKNPNIAGWRLRASAPLSVME